MDCDVAAGVVVGDVVAGGVVVGGVVSVEIFVSVWLMLTSCCKELTAVNWFTMSVGLMGLRGSCALSCAVSSDIKRFGSARPFEFVDALGALVEEVPVEEDVASAATGSRLLICMGSLS